MRPRTVICASLPLIVNVADSIINRSSAMSSLNWCKR
jgi:hypothetical protein